MNVLCSDCHEPISSHQCPTGHANLSPGMEAGAKERGRQITNEGWTAARDDMHVNGQLAAAAACYLEAAEMQAAGTFREHPPTPPIAWPWGEPHWKPSVSPKRNLEKAMALAAAEWDRLDRFEERNGREPVVYRGEPGAGKAQQHGETLAWLATRPPLPARPLPPCTCPESHVFPHANSRENLNDNHSRTCDRYVDF